MFTRTEFSKTAFSVLSYTFMKPISDALHRYNKCLVLFVFVSFLFSCKHDRDRDGVEDDRDKCPDVYGKTKDGCPVEKQIANVHFFIETSASMGGYFGRDAEFKTIVSDLTTKVNENIKSADIWFIADNLDKYNKNVQQFSSDIATTRIATQSSSQLHAIITKMASQTDSNDVSLLVSDCILSFPDADIRKNPEINREEAPNALKNTIFSTFSALKKKGMATSVYAFKSKFYGTYYDYKNTKKTLNGEERPFYVWVIADKELLPKFNAGLHDISSFKPEASLDFGLTEQPVTKYGVISQAEREGEWIWNKNDSTIEDINLKKGEQQFCVALSLKNLPTYAQSVSYLQNNLKTEVKGCEVSFEVKDKASLDQSKLRSTQQKQLFEDADHFIVFKIKEMNLPKASLHITLPLQADNWYTQWSTMDDTKPELTQNKTFAFQYLIAGVKEAYETRNSDYINLAIHLKQ